MAQVRRRMKFRTIDLPRFPAHRASTTFLSVTCSITIIHTQREFTAGAHVDATGAGFVG